LFFASYAKVPPLRNLVTPSLPLRTRVDPSCFVKVTVKSAPLELRILSSASRGVICWAASWRYSVKFFFEKVILIIASFKGSGFSSGFSLPRPSGPFSPFSGSLPRSLSKSLRSSSDSPPLFSGGLPGWPPPPFLPPFAPCSPSGPEWSPLSASDFVVINGFVFNKFAICSIHCCFSETFNK